ncbi:MAG: hypothetical protein P8019_00735 [Gammaproteobacteria bacterium]|jgi:hypothetical protein
MREELPEYQVEELTLEQAVLLLATEEEKQSTDYSRTSARLIESFAA